MAKTKKTGYKMKPRLKVFILTAILLYVGFVLFQQEMKLHEQAETKAALLQQIEEAKAQNQEIVRKIEYMKTDEYVEKVAREALGWVKEGEMKFMEKK